MAITAVILDLDGTLVDTNQAHVGSYVRAFAEDYVTTKSDVEASKLDADVVCATLDALGVPAREAVLVEDTIYDVQAAESAGVAVIDVSTWIWRTEELLEAGAVQVYDDPAAFLASLDDALQITTEPRDRHGSRDEA